MLIAQFSDLHIKANGKLAYKIVDTLTAAQTTIRHLNSFQPKIDIVVITGDLVDFGHIEEYHLVKKLLLELEIKFFIIPGNHDHRENLRTVLTDFLPLSHSDFITFTHETDDLVLIGLDTLCSGQAFGQLESLQLQWLEKKLKDHTSKRVLIFMHHPPLDLGIQHMDATKLTNTQELAKILKQRPQVCGLVLGHIHRSISGIWQGIPFWVAPGHSHSVSLNLTPNAPATFDLEPPAINLFKINKDSITQHLSYLNIEGVKDNSIQHQSYPFFDENNNLID